MTTEINLLLENISNSKKIAKKVCEVLSDHDMKLRHFTKESLRKDGLLKQRDKKVFELERKIESLSSELSKRDKTIAKLQDQVNKQKLVCRAIKPPTMPKKPETKKRAILSSSSSSVSSELEVEVGHVRALLSEKEEDNSELQKKVEKLKSRNVKLQNKIEFKNRQIDQLEHFQGQFETVSKLYNECQSEHTLEKSKLEAKCVQDKKGLERQLAKALAAKARVELKLRNEKDAAKAELVFRHKLTDQMEEMLKFDLKNNLLIAPSECWTDNEDQKISLDIVSREFVDLLEEIRFGLVISVDEFLIRVKGFMASLEEFIERDIHNCPANVHLYPKWCELVRRFKNHIEHCADYWQRIQDGESMTQSSVGSDSRQELEPLPYQVPYSSSQFSEGPSTRSHRTGLAQD
ncbi:hypothetical protein HDE_09195 [Halotydeus destructor]|nr:hypothetical protein HDE_09195 [Halotydeus destructor]